MLYLHKIYANIALYFTRAIYFSDLHELNNSTDGIIFLMEYTLRDFYRNLLQFTLKFHTRIPIYNNILFYAEHTDS